MSELFNDKFIITERNTPSYFNYIEFLCSFFLLFVYCLSVLRNTTLVLVENTKSQALHLDMQAYQKVSFNVRVLGGYLYGKHIDGD